MLLALYIVLLIIACGAILAWNFVPGLREKMRGWSTIAEAGIGTAAVYFGQFAGAVQDAQQAGYIPTQILEYVPFILLLWVIVKRFQTSTPAGIKK